MPPFSRKLRAQIRSLQECPKCGGVGHNCQPYLKHVNGRVTVPGSGCFLCKGSGKVTETDLVDYMLNLILES